MPSPTINSSLNGGPKRGSRLPVYSPPSNTSSTTNLKRTNDELRQHIARLKSELEIEKAKSRQVHRDKVAEIKRLKDDFDKEKAVAAGSLNHKQKIEHDYEVKKLRESFQREKELEIKHIIKFKDEELKTTKRMMLEDKEFSLKQLEEKLKKEFNNNKHKDVNDNDFRLRQEINEYQKQKNQLEELYKQKSASEAEKVEMIRKLKEEHDKETQRVLRDARIQIARNVHELKAAQKALSEKEQEITRREMDVTKLEEEKEILFDKLRSEPKRIADQFDASSAQRSEREKELQVKNAELKKSLDEMTRKASILERYNIHKRSDSKETEPPSRADQRIKELKKRNGELVALAKKLDEKAKRLQDELKEIKSKGSPVKTASFESPVAFDSFKRSFTLQRARELAENAKTTISKDKEIAKLKQQIATLEKQDDKADGLNRIEELETKIARLESEKLKLEQQISAEKSAGLDNLRSKSREEESLRKELKSAEREKEKLKKLLDEQERENRKAKDQIVRSKATEDEKLKKEIDLVVKEKDKWKKLLEEQKSENKQMKNKVEQLTEKSGKFDKLAEQLKERDEECTALAEDLRSAEKEIQKLKDVLADTERTNKKLEHEQEKGRQIAKSLQSKMADMSKKLVEMQSFEFECKVLKDRLQDSETKHMMMQGQLDSLQSKVEEYKIVENDLEEKKEECRKWERDYDYAVEQITKKDNEVSLLNQAKEDAEKSHEIETTELRNEINRLENTCLQFERKEVDLKEMLETARENMKVDISRADVSVQTSRPHTPVQAQRAVAMEETFSSFEQALEDNYTNDVNNQYEAIEEDLEQDVSWKADDDILDFASSRIAELAVVSSSEGELSRGDDPRPNRLTALNTVDSNIPHHNTLSKTVDKDDAVGNRLAHRILQRQNSDTSDELTLSLDDETDSELEDQLFEADGVNLLASNALSNTPSAIKRLEYQKKTGSDDSVFGPITPQTSVDEKPASGDSNTVSAFSKKQDVNATSGLSAKTSLNADKLTVFIAKYTYDPYEHSPNDEPSLELSLQAGDFVYVFGEADEDGFYTGELVNGQRGLVPSNFVERVSDDGELPAIIVNGHEGYPGDESDEDLTEVSGLMSPTESIIGDAKQSENDTPLDAEYLKTTPRNQSLTKHLQNIDDVFKEDLDSLNSETDGDDDGEIFGFPPPRQLKLERQLNSSVVLSWLPPDGIAESDIHGYAIKADGVIKQTLIGAGRTKAIVSDIQRSKVYRVSVHTLDKHGKESPNSVATITVGRGASAVPSDVRISNLAPRSANLEWTCGNSSYAHAICIGGKVAHVVKPGVDRFLLNNLVPDTEYEIAIEARKAKDIHKKPTGTVCVSDELIFRTPEEGLPEPPLNVQVQLCDLKPRSQSQVKPSILVSWLPVTITDIGTSNGSIVQGYAVYMNYAEVCRTESATDDHVVIPCDQLRHVSNDFTFKTMKFWVTSQSSNGESALSNIVSLSEEVIGLIKSMITEDSEMVAAKENGLDWNAGLESGINDEKVALKNMAVDEIPVNVGTVEQDEKMAFSEENIKPTTEIEDLQAAVVESQAPPQRVKGKSTVIKYDVTDSDSSGDDEDSESDEVIQHGYKGEEETHDATSKSKVDEAPLGLLQEIAEEERHAGQFPLCTEPKLFQSAAFLYVQIVSSDMRGKAEVVSPSAEESEAGSEATTESLKLPEIPHPDCNYNDHDEEEDDPEDDEEVETDQPVVRINFDDLLLSDSELSAIEEETVEDLLEYDHEEDRSISPGHTFSLEKDPEMHPEDNKTFSLDSGGDDKERNTFEIERAPAEKLDRKYSMPSSKDTLTFSSDDIIDILDTDVVGDVPDLPRDDDKATRPVRDINADKYKKRDLVEEIPDENKPSGSVKNRPGDKASGFSELKGEQFNAKSTANEHVPKVVENSELPPAIRAPVQAKDHAPVNNNFGTLIGPTATVDNRVDEGNKLLKDKKTADNVLCHAGIDSNEELNSSAIVEPGEDGEDGFGSLGVEAGSVTVEFKDISAPNSTADNNTTRAGAFKTDVDSSADEGRDSMGQAIEREAMPTRSVHDLYSFHAAGASFDESTLDSEEPDNVSGCADNDELDLNGENDLNLNVSVDQVVDSVSNRDAASQNHTGAPQAPQSDRLVENTKAKLKINAPLTTSKPGGIESTTTTAVVSRPIDETKRHAAIPNNTDNENTSHVNGNSNENTRTNHVLVDESLNGAVNDNGGNLNDNVRVFIALFSYDPYTMSPNSDGLDEELAFVEGDLIRIVGDVDGDGFYYGELNDKHGYVPSNMVQEVSLHTLGQSLNIPPPPEQGEEDSEGADSATATRSRRDSNSRKQSPDSTSKQPATTSASLRSTTETGKNQQTGAANQNTQPGNLDTMNGQQKRDSRQVNDITADVVIEDEDDKKYRYISERDSIYCLPPRRMIALYDYDPAVSSPNVDSEVEMAFGKGEIIYVFGDMDEDGFYAAQNGNEKGLVPSNFLEECPEPQESEEIEINMGAESPSIKEPFAFRPCNV
eukprot:gene14162-15641_t